MNYMNKQDLIRLQKLSAGIGEFIRYWGFRKIHGQIWAVVYLTKEPMSGIEIGELLGVSKALISPALKELEAEGLIVQTKSENAKTKRYIAEEDVTKIIQGVLQRREVPMIEKITSHYQELADHNNKGVELEAINPERLAKMGTMIQMAQLGLMTLLNSDGIWGE